MSTRLPNRQFTAEFKHEAVQLVSESGLSIHEVSRRLGIASSTRHCWVHDINTAAPAQLAKHGKVVSDAEAQLSKLLRENAQLRMENEFLKKLDALVQQRKKQPKKN